MRRTILDACIEAFSETGFRGATMRDIAQRAGISHTGLLHHFPTKGGLLIEVLQARDVQMAQLIQSERRDFLHAQIEVERDNASRPGMIQLHTIISAEATDAAHPAHDLYRERYADLRIFLTAFFEMQRDHDRLRLAAPPAALANLFVAAIDGLQLQWLYHPDEVDVAESLTALVNALVTEAY